jgi:hypothetical protein
VPCCCGEAEATTLCVVAFFLGGAEQTRAILGGNPPLLALSWCGVGQKPTSRRVPSTRAMGNCAARPAAAAEDACDDLAPAARVLARPEMWAIIAEHSGLVGAWRLTGVCRAS